MNGLREAQHLYDRRNEAILVFHDDEVPPARYEVTDSGVEDFIADVVAAADPAAFLESVGLHYNEDCDFDLHVAVARQWVADKEKVGGIIGAVFWKWAKDCAYGVGA